jgi:3-oxoacyl-[acyl-carrier protein] reductase
VSDLAAQDAALSRTEAELCPMTTLVNNAGVGVMRRGDPLDVTEESYERCMRVNAKALFLSLPGRGQTSSGPSQDPSRPRSIINVTSSNATAASAPRSEYCASKAAASMISKCFAVRLGPDGIAVYDVQPGLIENPHDGAGHRQLQAAGRRRPLPFPWVGQPDDVAGVVASLATNRLPYTTGHVISVDGGMLLPRF